MELEFESQLHCSQLHSAENLKVSCTQLNTHLQLSYQPALVASCSRFASPQRV